MRFSHLGSIEIFLSVAKNKSFILSAKELGLSPSAVSASVKKLEQHFNVPLVVRTTRKVALSDAGQKFFELASNSFQNLESAFEEMKSFNSEPAGFLRITMPATVYKDFILPRLPEFYEKYPKIEMECDIENRKMDIMVEGFDAGIRSRDIIAQDMIGVKLSERIRYACVASPSYFKKYGTPTKPQDLVKHNCIVPRVRKGLTYDRWEFEYRKKEFEVKVSGNLIVNNLEAYSDSALAGLGIAYLPEHSVEKDIEKKRLVECLHEYASFSEGFYIYFPKSRQTEAKLRAFIEHFKYR